MNRYCAASLMVVASVIGCTNDVSTPPTVAGAGYTTFDADRGGCLNAASAVHCNTYASKDQVFLAGGPDDTANGLPDGTYFFAVLAPGSQLAGFLVDDAANPVANRTFTVEDHQVTSYTGTHPVGATVDGRPAIGLAPFDNSDHPGGVYIVAICAVGADDPAQCTYDAFRIGGDDPPQLPIAHGGAYYDANLDGEWNAGEPGLPRWQVDYYDMTTGTVETDADGAFTLELIPDGYLFGARQPQDGAWLATTPVDRARTEGGASASLHADRTYWIEAADHQVVRGLVFGFVCVAPGGGGVQPSPATCPAPLF